MAAGTVYLYFHSKDDLLVSIFERSMNDVLAEARAALDAVTEPGERLQRIARLHLERLGADRDDGGLRVHAPPRAGPGTHDLGENPMLTHGARDAWIEGARSSASASEQTSDETSRFVVPRRFVALAQTAAAHPDSGRWATMYRVLWRLVHERRDVLEDGERQHQVGADALDARRQRLAGARHAHRRQAATAAGTARGVVGVGGFGPGGIACCWQR